MSNLIGFSTQTSGKRQAITQGPLNASGFPNAIAATTGLNVQITASATNAIRCNFADGLIDFPATYSSAQTLTLAASTTTFIYLERNSSTNAVTLGTTTIAPVYDRIAPALPAVGQHWFKTSDDSLISQPGMTMYERVGGSWVARQRVFLGEVSTLASAIASVANYAYGRRYQSDWIAVVTGGAFINFTPNLGMTPMEAQSNWAVYARLNAADSLHTFVGMDIWYGVYPIETGGRLNQTLLMGYTGLCFIGGVWQTAVDIRLTVIGGW